MRPPRSASGSRVGGPVDGALSFEQLIDDHPPTDRRLGRGLDDLLPAPTHLGHDRATQGHHAHPRERDLERRQLPDAAPTSAAMTSRSRSRRSSASAAPASTSCRSCSWVARSWCRAITSPDGILAAIAATPCHRGLRKPGPPGGPVAGRHVVDGRPVEPALHHHRRRARARAAHPHVPRARHHPAAGLRPVGGRTPRVAARRRQRTAKIGSAGRPPLLVDVRIVTADGPRCVVGETGELLVRGPNVMAGYWRRPDDTREVRRRTAGCAPATRPASTRKASSGSSTG